MPPEPSSYFVRAFLLEIVGDSTLEDLAREVERWAGTGDLNEMWIAWVRLRASELLRLVDGEVSE